MCHVASLHGGFYLTGLETKSVLGRGTSTTSFPTFFITQS